MFVNINRVRLPRIKKIYVDKISLTMIFTRAVKAPIHFLKIRTKVAASPWIA